MVRVSECACGKGGMMSTAAGKKIAIVTGSALGLGYELTRQLIAKGWFVAGIDFNGARQTELSKTLLPTNTEPLWAIFPTNRS